MTEDNSYAGQGAVLLDIGGDIGALIVAMPSTLAGEEIEIRRGGHHPAHDRDAHHYHPHVGVVGRLVGDRTIHSAVFGELREGSYELSVRPDGPVQLRVQISGGCVTEAVWPT
jgi:hypothetical protein